MSINRDPHSGKRPERARDVGVHFDGDLRRALIQAAATALDEVGADHLSLRDVARRIGVSHTAPAHHFTDKAGLLTAVAVEGFHLFIEHLGGALAATRDRRPLDRLPALARAYAEFAERHPGRFEVMFRPALIRPDDPDYQRAGDAAFAALREHIGLCQRQGWRPDVPTATLAAATWAFSHGIATLRGHGSLARHYGDASFGGVELLVTAMLGGAGQDPG
ncbi:TetR/AcrR family transcriptional regulator [Nonomuraea sp. NPDC050783]|uniref:TetR/AcrR family transcriptional regulator n=1 Tax=Nonomuraea sp. NPDC050783 TaxID=3154634 RepID=UPI003465174C